MWIVLGTYTSSITQVCNDMKAYISKIYEKKICFNYTLMISIKDLIMMYIQVYLKSVFKT